jgi:hypothetical protein
MHRLKKDQYQAFVVALLLNRLLLEVDPLFREEMTPDEAEDLLRVVASRQVTVHVRVRHDRLEGVGQKKLAELKIKGQKVKFKPVM